MPCCLLLASIYGLLLGLLRRKPAGAAALEWRLIHGQ